jgi:soluble lytic murein transglycosylase-like protein
MRQLKGIQGVVNGVTTDNAGRGLIACVGRTLTEVFQLVRAQAWQLAGAALTCTAVILLTGNPVDRTPFAVPAPALVKGSWSDEVSNFGERVHKAFGIRRHVANEFSGWILEASARQGLSPELLASVVFAESSFRKDVTSHMGAIGPAQVKPYWSPFCGSVNLSDPAENIYCGAQILAHYRDVCGSEECALSAYNVGMKNERSDVYFQQLGRVYARKIDRHLERIENTML